MIYIKLYMYMSYSFITAFPNISYIQASAANSLIRHPHNA